MAQGKKWVRDELLVVLNLYHKLNFGQLHARQPVVIAVAEKLGRTPDSVAMKLTNLASLDPALQLRGIKGLSGASKLDQATWNEFHENLADAVAESENRVLRLFEGNPHDILEVLPKEGIRVRKSPPSGPTEIDANIKQRRGQDFFQDVVLNNYNERCGVSLLPIRELLVASHILPWKTYPVERLNVCNGICLSRLHDAAFDQGFISFDDRYRLILSPRLKDSLSQRSVQENFVAYEGSPLQIPEDAKLPNPAFLAEHRRSIFR